MQRENAELDIKKNNENNTYEEKFSMQLKYIIFLIWKCSLWKAPYHNITFLFWVVHCVWKPNLLRFLKLNILNLFHIKINHDLLFWHEAEPSCSSRKWRMYITTSSRVWLLSWQHFLKILSFDWLILFWIWKYRDLLTFSFCLMKYYKIS